MKVMNTKMSLQLLVALGLISGSFACSCLDMTVNERFCTGNFAAIIYVEGGQEVVDFERISNSFIAILTRNDRIYDIRILETLRGNIQQADKNHLKVGTHSCGVTFQVNKYYVITGHASDGQPLTTNMCQFIRMFDSHPAGSFQVPTCPAPPRPVFKLPDLIISTEN
ncbi:uncharacterized protein LOC127850385 [Dreissena polymorpha]|uniref:NTR domain-containing protein n=1 Tax=Dreissena polymorpha TaxID=45954 RepID=A0A9D4S2V9_DREPO|nr:uncharacterized protein LOC127850385 [Dreissena polymorpha]KAH3889756.1 hypothetical protein DPMN_013819 [Dreissena polymorpha]